MSLRPAPCAVAGGLAIYRFGTGRPVLFMPHPHPASVIGDPVPDAIVGGFVGLGREVVTFDPPGNGRSTRRPRLDMGEMLSCAMEALGVCGVTGPVDIAGHSQGGMAALAFALAHPPRVRRLVLACASAGGAEPMKAPGALWHQSHPAFNRLSLLGALFLATNRLAFQKAMLNLVTRVSFVDRGRAHRRPISSADIFRRADPRMAWARRAMKMDYAQHLAAIVAPALVAGGRHDPQIPLACVERLARGLPNARLIVFERSGHYPFIEEPDLFWREVGGFIAG